MLTPAKRLGDALGGVRISSKNRSDGSTPPEDRTHPGSFGEEGIAVEVNENSEGQILASIDFRNLSIEFAHELIRFARSFQLAQTV